MKEQTHEEYVEALRKAVNGRFYLLTAGKLSSWNRTFLELVDRCGCYYCCRIYSPTEIKAWVDVPERGPNKGKGQTALCPYCDIDSVMPDMAPFQMTEEFLKEMARFWFS